jgi:hypothetical protein
MCGYDGQILVISVILLKLSISKQHFRNATKIPTIENIISIQFGWLKCKKYVLPT